MHSIIFLNSLYRTRSGEEDAPTEVEPLAEMDDDSDVDFADFADDDASSQGFTPWAGILAVQELLRLLDLCGLHGF